MTRRQQLWVLIFLSAATAMLQYVIQGASATGGDPLTFSPNFWVADYILWGIRALVEAWIIVFVFETKSRTWYHSLFLTTLEIGLIALITLTLGPALHALSSGQTIYQVTGEQHWLWTYAIAAYTSIMMGSAAFAYRIQPFDLKEESKPEGQVVRLRRERGKPNVVVPDKVDQDFFASGNGKISKEEAVPLLVKEIEDAGTINATQFAEEHGITRQTVSNWVDWAARQGMIVKLSGRGQYALPETMEVPEF